MNSISRYVFCEFSGSQNCHIDPVPKFPDLLDRIPWRIFFVSIPILQPSSACPETPIFFSVFLKCCVLHEDSPKMARNSCQKECYYLVSEARGWFLCWDQIPLRAKFAFLPVGLLKPFFSPETSIFIAFSRFSEIGNFWRARPPPHYFYLILQSPPSKTPKSAQKIAQHGGQIVPSFLTPIFVVFLGHFWSKKCETAIHPYISSTALEPRNHYISSVFLSMHQKRRRQTATRGDQIPLLYLPR